MDKKDKILVRVLNTDLHGNKDLYTGLCKIKGVNFNFSNAICSSLNLDRAIKINQLSIEQIKKIEEFVKDPKSLEYYLLNRQKDYDSGEDKHLSTTDIKFRKEFDIKRLQKIKSYRGLRHAAGLPVRGQRTKGHFRKGKTVGVSKKKGKAGK
ncbi:MAG: 30S ribosomal protein S13 [archaeon]